MTFNPFTRKPLNVQTRLMMLSMEKTIRVLLLNICRFVYLTAAIYTNTCLTKSIQEQPPRTLCS